MATQKINKSPTLDDFLFIPRVKVLGLTPSPDSAPTLPVSSITGIRAPANSINYTTVVEYLQAFFSQNTGFSLPLLEPRGAGPCIELEIDPCVDAYSWDASASRSPERYRLHVDGSGVLLIGASAEGLFRAATTFAQLLLSHPCELPCVGVDDYPDFPARGLLRDVTRGRVPTLDSLMGLADTLAFYKVNRMQLYVEHAFAFSKIPELHAGKTPLTRDDILALDEYCAKRYIELVPALSTFGHLYEMLRLPRFEHLNELDVKASQAPRCLWDRMAHYTLDVSNPESLELVRGMIEEYAPLFRSPRFNISCDETFDLGKGKNAGRAEREGVGRLYTEFVNKVIGVVKSVGKRPMLWGDIVLKHPESLRELPPELIFLNWDYLPDATDESVKKFKAAATASASQQYVCPGVQGWSRFAADVDRACKNISRMVRFGREAGAGGVLNTDWGDCGHVNLGATSYHGVAFGAALSWDADDDGYDGDGADGDDWYDGDGGINTDGVDGGINTDHVDGGINTDHVDGGINTDGGYDKDIGYDGDDFDRRFAFLQWGLKGPSLGKLLRELGGLSSDYHFGNLYAWVNDKQCLWYKEEEVRAMDMGGLVDRAVRAYEIKDELIALMDDVTISHEDVCRGRRPRRPVTKAHEEFEEYVWSASATGWLLRLLIIKKKYEYGQGGDVGTDGDVDIDVDVDVASPERLIDDGRILLHQFKSLWLARNRESELCDVVETFEKIFKRLRVFRD